MKNKIIFIIMAIFWCNDHQAQGIFPFLPDVPSNTGSTILIPEYIGLTVIEKKIQRELKRFTKLYSSRMLYNIPITGSSFSEKVKTKLQSTITRKENLAKSNDSLHTIYYSKKKKNKESLLIITSELDRLKTELSNQIKTAGVIGEKENLYQNFSLNILRIQEKLDQIESNISTSKNLRLIIESTKR